VTAPDRGAGIDPRTAPQAASRRWLAAALLASGGLASGGLASGGLASGGLASGGLASGGLTQSHGVGQAAGR